MDNASKRLLIVGNYPPPFGGVPHHIERLSDYLTHRGWDVHVLSAGNLGNFEVGGVKIYKPTHRRKLVAWASMATDRVFEQWLASGDLPDTQPAWFRGYKMLTAIGRDIVRRHGIQLIASYNMLSYGPIGARLAEEGGIPHALTIFGELYKNDALGRSNRPFLQAVAQRTQALLSCSRHCGDSLSRIGIAAPVRDITFGINLEHFSPRVDGGAMRQRLGFTPADEVVAFVGRLGREMGLDTFLESAQALARRRPGTRFIIAGQKEELLLDARVVCERLAGRAVVLTDVPYDELPQCYAAADVVAVPTRGARTCSSLAAMEAMAVGRPVVANAIGGIPEVVEHGQNGVLVEPGDPLVLAEAVESLLEDKERARHLACRGTQRAMERFDETLVNARYERVFENLLAAT